jgi:steroid delta-isomerase-like uncharacterized protein
MATTNEIHRQFVDAWNRRDWDSLRNLLHSEYRYTGPDGKEFIGPEEGLKISRTYATAFPDGKLEIKNIYVAGNVQIAEFRATGTHKGDLKGIAPTNKPFDITVCNVIEVRDGKAYREREYFDMLTLMAQLGVVQPPGMRAA